MIRLVITFLLISVPAYAETPIDQIQTIKADQSAEILATCPQFTQTELVEISYKPDNYYTEDTPSVLFRSFIQERSLQNERGQEKTKQHIETITADTPETVIKIYSVGGHQIEVRRILDDIEKTTINGKRIITHAYKKAVSASFFLLMAGSPDYRIIDSDTRIIAHAVRRKGIEKNTVKFVEDFPANSPIHMAMNERNQWSRDILVKYSTNGITKECADKIIPDKVNVEISPETALKAGWVDIVAFPEKEMALIRKD